MFQLLLRAFKASFSNSMVAWRQVDWRDLWRQHPFHMTNVVLGLSVLAVTFCVMMWWNIKYLYSPLLTRYPPEVAQALRRAIYYTTVGGGNPQLALKWYTKALELCEEAGYDYFADEAISIKLMIAFWLQKINSQFDAVKVLESLLKECLRFVEVADKAIATGTVPRSMLPPSERVKAPEEPENKRRLDEDGASGAAGSASKPGPVGSQRGPAKETAMSQEQNQEVGDQDEGNERATQPAKVWGQRRRDRAEELRKEGKEVVLTWEKTLPPENIYAKRTRILKQAVKIAVQLGDLYVDAHVLEPELAQERLSWAVTTALSELRRRHTEGTKEEEGPWLTQEEIAKDLESLGHDYERKSMFDLALPLFFHALTFSRDPCHTATLMNNISASYAQLPTKSYIVETPMTTHALDLPDPSKQSFLVGGGGVSYESTPASDTGFLVNPTPAQRRERFLQTAGRWATRAAEHAAEPASSGKRTAECDEACAVALCNLADIARLAGDAEGARRKYEEAIAMSRTVGFAPGVEQAGAGLKLLDSEKGERGGRR